MKGGSTLLETCVDIRAARDEQRQHVLVAVLHGQMNRPVPVPIPMSKFGPMIQ